MFTELKHKLSSQKNLIRITAACVLVYKIMCLKLWISTERYFPKINLIEAEILNNEVLDLSLNSIALLLLLVLIIRPSVKLLLAYACLEIILITLDINRLQPLIFQTIILASLLFIKPQNYRQNLLFLLCLTYACSGLHKLNLIFINTIWSPSILVDFLGLPSDLAFSKPLKAIGLFSGAIELVLGLALLTKYRKLACQILILMHLFILLYLGPLGINFNQVVWVWNILMIYYLFSLSVSKAFSISKSKVFYVVVAILLLINPVLYLFNQTHPYLSFSFYGGKRHYQVLKCNKLPRQLQTYAFEHSDNAYQISLNNWSLNELNVPFAGTNYQLKQVLKKLSKIDNLQVESAYQLNYPFDKKQKVLLKLNE